MQQTITYSELSPDILQDHKLWINTTPVGMFPHTEDCLPLPLHVLNKDFEVFDLIYNPEKTTLLLMAERQGARIRNGYQMLVEQAEASYHHFISAEMSL
jgi:shikimate dehydrogenase